MNLHTRSETLRRDRLPKALYISFIMGPPSEDPMALPKLHKYLLEIFGNRSISCITEGEETGVDREVIFRISTPVVVNDQVWEEWFKKLEKLFKHARDYTPFFTNEEER